jgi:hypothetical protein
VKKNISLRHRTLPASFEITPEHRAISELENIVKIETIGCDTIYALSA